MCVCHMFNKVLTYLLTYLQTDGRTATYSGQTDIQTYKRLVKHYLLDEGKYDGHI